MNKHYIVLSCLIITACSNSSLPKLPQPVVLNTQYQEPTYYYCLAESCIQPSQLTVDVVSPLQPDEPIVTPLAVESVPTIQTSVPVTPVKATPVKKHIKRTHYKHRIKSKRAVAQHKPQCVLWK